MASQNLNSLYKKYIKSLRSHIICKYHIPNDSVDDVLQEIFLKFFKNIESYREDCSIPSYLNKIAESVASDYWLKKC